MILFRIMARLEAAEKRITALEAAKAEFFARDTGDCGKETGETPVFKLDDAKLQEGISNVMGYDPFGKKRSDV